MAAPSRVRHLHVMRAAWLALCVACSSDTTPKPVIENLDVPTAFAIDADAFFWTTTGGDLFTAPTSGGKLFSAPFGVAAVTNDGSQLAFDEGAIYLANAETGLFRVDRITKDVTQLDTGFVMSVADHTGDVYWTTLLMKDGGIKRLTLGSSTPEILSSDLSMVIAVDAAGVYWVDGVQPGICIFCDPCKGAFPLRQRKGDGSITTLATMTPGAGSLAADGDAVYVSDSCAGTITRFDHVSGAMSVLASGLGKVTTLVLDHDDVYALIGSAVDMFGDITTLPGLVRIPKNGGAVTQLKMRGTFPSGIVLDDANVYYVAIDGPDKTKRTIFSVAKPNP